MMISLQFAVFWCVVQVFVLSLISLFLSRRWLARQPRAASHIATGAMVAVILTTLLIPLRVHWMTDWIVTNRIVPVPEAGSRSPPDESRAAVSLPSDGAVSSPPGVWNVRSLLCQLHDLQNITAAEGFVWTKWAMLGLAIASLVGLLNVVMALFSIQRIRRSSRPITSPRIVEMIGSIRLRYGIQKPVFIVESDLIDCAAVVGVFRPVVVLSTNWPQWSQDELQAVLSHELAHIRKGDVSVRLIALIGVSLHIYNPMLRWLGHQLVLAQELAVDQLAMPLAGGSGNYIRTLSGLLLRLDAGTGVRSPSWVMPVFSGDWIRRINMLRTMDGVATQQSRGLSRLAIGLIAVLAIGSTTLRVLAQGDDRPAARPESPASASSKAESTNGPSFQRPKVSAQQIVFVNDKGGFQVNFAELRKSPGFGRLVQTALEFQLTGATGRQWDLSALDLLVSNVYMRLEFRPDEQQKHALTMGFTKSQVRTNRDLDWNNLVRTFLPDSKERPDLGTRILEAVIPALGPKTSLIQPLGPRELVFGQGEAIDTKAPVAVPAWAQEWNAISGGVFTLTLPITDHDKLPDFGMEPAGEHLYVLTHGVDLLSIGIDVGASDHTFELRARLRCRDLPLVTRVRTALQGIVDYAIHEIHPGAEQRGLSLEQKVMSDLLNSFRMIEVADEPQVVECRFQCEIPKELLDHIQKELDEEGATVRKAIEQASEKIQEAR